MEKELPRLQKALAAAGVASRRACEALIAEGHVQVNGKVVRTLGTRVDPDSDDIRVDGERIPAPTALKPLYIMLHKPVGFTSTAHDPHAEHTVLELLTQIEERVYPVGRLDVDSDGLLLLTNDGDFANRLTHPRYHVPKIYRVRARGFVGRTAAIKLAEGIELEDGKTAPAEVRFIEYDAGSLSTIVEITLYEGRNRQVRRMFDAIGNPVRQLTRIGFGNLRMGGLNSGTWRKLRPDEVDQLLDLAKPTPTPPKTARRPKPSGPYRPPYMPKGTEPRDEGKVRREEESEPSSATSHQSLPASRPVVSPRPQDRRVFSAERGGEKRYGNPYHPSAPETPHPAGPVRPPQRPRTDAGSPKPRGVTPSGSKSQNGNRSHNGSRPQEERYANDADYGVTRPLSQPARAATPYEKKIAKLAKGKDRGAGIPPSRPQETGIQRQKSSQARPAPRSANPVSKIPSTPPPQDGSMNSASGRKAGIPYVPRPKTGHSKFGRSRP